MLNMNKQLVKILSALVVLSANTRLFAQSESTENPTTLDYNIPSPNAAGISRYDGIPVNLFTGVPGISVPLYNVNAGNHTLPISISYHASGIKNNDISSDAGLGWSLSATYTISRTIRGGKDEMGYVGHNENELIVKGNASTSTDETIDSFRYSAKGLWDTQPDEFSFNIAGASGKFVMSPDKIIIMPDQDIKIDYTTAAGNFYFVLTDAKGVKYYFNDISTSSTIGCSDDGGTLDYASTWYISKIIYPDTRDSLLFTYATESLTLSNTSESKNYDYGITTPVKNHTCLSSTSISEKKISQIDFPFGKVKFTYNKAKLEISGSNALGYFEVFDKQNISVQKTSFAYSYYNNTSGSNLLKKLKLDSVYTTIASGETDNKHIFSYNGTNIAAYQAKSQDHWGYYNGATNTSMIPGNTFIVYDASGMPFYVPGGNREPNATYSGIGVLNKIQYPTGGTTTFEFENNSYGFDCEGAVNDSVFNTTTKTATANCLGNTSPFFEVTPVDFTVSRSQATSIVITSNTYNCTGNTRKFTLKDLTTNTVIAEGMVSVPSVDLVAGHNYRLTAEAHCEFAEANMLDCEEFITAKISYQTFSGTINKTKLAGGLRVKTITDYDPQSGVSNVRKYEYQVPSETVRSSGVLMYKPRYDYVYHYDLVVDPDDLYIVPMTSLCYTSEGNNSPQNNDYIVGYQYVKEITGTSGEGGSTLYNYGIPYRSCDAGFPFVPYTSTKHRNGQLLSATVYDNLGQQVRQSRNYYSYPLKDKIPGWKAAYVNIGTTVPGTLVFTKDRFTGSLYNYISEKIRLDSTVTEETLSAAATITKQGFTYLNSSAYYPYLTTTKNSDGIASTQTVWRSGDFTVTPTTGLTGVTAALKFMITNHLTDYPVEIFTKAGSQVTGGTINEYALNTGKINPAETFMLELPSPATSYTQVSRNITTNVATLTKDSKYTSATKYTGYNEKGNPAALSAAGNKQVSLVWGYGKTLPIAKMSYAGTADLAATSFEADAEGNWTYDPTGCTTAQLLTGKQSFNLTGKNVTRSTVAAAGNYIVSYWRRSGTVTVNSATPGLTGTTINGWTYCEHRLTDPGNITVSGTTYIDELRFYPENAAMTSYTHNPLFGITTLADQNNNILYYEYDGFGRLKTVKDQNGKILNQYTYTIQGTE